VTDLHWAPRIERGGKPLYLAIADALAADLRNGRLSPGARLPPQREMAAALGVDLTTVTRAYNEARRRGLLIARVGRGSFVAAPEAVRPYGAPSGAPVDLTMNMPPMFDDDALLRRLTREMAEAQARGGLELLLRYQDPGGTVEDRALGAAWLQPRIAGVTTERTVVAAGAQAGLLAVLASLTDHGDAICAEALAYPGLRAVAAQLGLDVVGLAMDDEGVLPSALARVCREVGPKVLCCTPTLQNPTTATMSERRREQIVAVARRFRLPILEDDAYGRLPARAPPSLAALAPELTWHVAGLAKLASPALRIAYIACPDGHRAAQVAARLRATTGMASPLTAAVAGRWIQTGLADELLRAIREESRMRRRLAADVLGLAAAEPADAFHLWLPMRGGWTRAGFQAALRAHDVSVVPSDAFVTAGEPPEAVRIGLGAPRTRADLDHALRAITRVLDAPPALATYA
jgi:DNA-binding transcriptional MocR family regulator